MIFKLNEEQELLRKTVHDFAEDEIAPKAAEMDEKEEYDMNLWGKMAEMGLTGIPFPDEYDGAGMDSLSYAIAVEELSRACASTGLLVLSHTSLCAWPLYVYGSEEQKKKYLQPLACGEKLGAMAILEPGAGTGASANKTTAVKDGDHYVLNGAKSYVNNGGLADIFVVFADTGEGISAFIAEKDTQGFVIGKEEHKMGARAASTCEIILENCRVPAANLLGKEGRGADIAGTARDAGRLGIAAQALGIAQGAYEQALEYSKVREQFGRPISANQGVQCILADMATQIDAARMLVYRAAYLMDSGQPYSRQAAMAKLFASETAISVGTNAVQVFGGYGFSREYPVERMMRDAVLTGSYEGSSQFQRVFIATDLLK